MDERAATRAARTALTGAECAGRMGAYRRALALGVGVRKRWLATLDGRTRDSHRLLDGESVGVEERFSNGLLYPGDPTGPASEVWNCRCTLVADVAGVDADGQPRPSRAVDETDPKAYEAWKRGHGGERASGRSAKRFLELKSVRDDMSRLGISDRQASDAMRAEMRSMGFDDLRFLSGLSKT